MYKYSYFKFAVINSILEIHKEMLRNQRICEIQVHKSDITNNQ